MDLQLRLVPGWGPRDRRSVLPTGQVVRKGLCFFTEQASARKLYCGFWMLFCLHFEQWLVWLSGNGVRHINEVKLRQARLVLGLVMTFGVSTILVFIQVTQAHSACHPSVGRCNEYRRWFWPLLGRNGASEVTTSWHFINQFININLTACQCRD